MPRGGGGGGPNILRGNPACQPPHCHWACQELTLPASLPACPALPHSDLTRVRLHVGDASFLWGLTALTTLRVGGSAMPPPAFLGLSALRHLAELDVSDTQFDDAAAAQLASAAALRSLTASATLLRNAGLKELDGCSALRTLQVEGCRVSVMGVVRTLRRHRGLVMWGAQRSTLFRCGGQARLTERSAWGDFSKGRL